MPLEMEKNISLLKTSLDKYEFLSEFVFHHRFRGVTFTQNSLTFFCVFFFTSPDTVLE